MLLARSTALLVLMAITAPIGCGLNPQPEPPSATGDSRGSGGTGGTAQGAAGRGGATAGGGPLFGTGGLGTVGVGGDSAVVDEIDASTAPESIPPDAGTDAGAEGGRQVADGGTLDGGPDAETAPPDARDD